MTFGRCLAVAPAWHARLIIHLRKAIMSFFKSLPANAGPGDVFAARPDVYGPWSEMSEALMNGPSELSQAERELILAFAAGAAGCRFVYVAHSEVAYARGVPRGLLDELLESPDAAPIDARMRSLLAFVRQLTLSPGSVRQGDVDAVLRAGWSEKALQDVIAVTARAAFMQRLVQANGFEPMTRDAAALRARERVQRGYVNLFPAFRHAE